MRSQDEEVTWALLGHTVSGGIVRFYGSCKAAKSVEFFFAQESILRNPRIAQNILLCNPRIAQNTAAQS